MNCRRWMLFVLVSPVGVAGAMKFASQGTRQLEDAYIKDCQANSNPHGYYGAFFQPCEFSFFQSTTSTNNIDNDDESESTVGTNVCADPSSTLLAKPVPVHWFFNLTDHIKKNDWDSIDWNDADWKQVAQNLFLWPDQCVGVEPRCYSLTDEAIFNAVQPFFSATNNIPAGATHVQVNCQADAWMLSRTVSTLAESIEKILPTLIAWMVTLVLLATVALVWCIYACVRLCRSGPVNDRRRPFERESPVASVLGTGYAYHGVDDTEVMIYPEKVKQIQND